MTREEAIEEIRYYCQDSEEIIEAINQSSEDCVSRQEVLKGYIEVERADGVEIYSEKAVPITYINNLPPVTPTRKKGKWINKSHTSDCGIKFVASECTCCGKKTFFDCDQLVYNYCPNCGAKMVESQESEDKK